MEMRNGTRFSQLPRRAIGAGLAAGPLVLAAIFTLPDPSSSKGSAKELVEFYADKDTGFRIAAVLLALGMIAFFSFAASLATAVRTFGDENSSLPSLILVGGTCFAMLLLTTVASFTAEGHMAKSGAAMDVVLGVEEIGHMTFHVSGIPLAVFVAATALAHRSANLTPRWTTISGLIIAPAAFAFGIAYFEKAIGDKILHQIGLFGVVFSLIWILASSISLLRQSIVHKPALEPVAATA